MAHRQIYAQLLGIKTGETFGNRKIIGCTEIHGLK